MHYKQIARQAIIISKSYTLLWKCKSNLDRARTLQSIELQKHELHCLCVECWVADYEEYRYGEKKRSTDDFHQQLVLFRKPNI